MNFSFFRKKSAPAGNLPARVPILTWHSMDVGGDSYERNQHIAFREDLETIHKLGLKVVPVAEIAQALVEGRLYEMQGCVGLTFDDGSDFDYYDLPHPTWGPQRGIAGILRDFIATHGPKAQPKLHATSFAIVSPAARQELDRTCMIGTRWWNDEWWQKAEKSGLMSIESHGWDHNHESLQTTVADTAKGHFDLRSRDAADAEIAQASELLKRLRGRNGPVLLAYPYGEASGYLVNEYLDKLREHHGVVAAFSTVPEAVTPETSRWEIPRFVSGWHWKSPNDLERVLRKCGALEQAPNLPSGRAPEVVPNSWRELLQTWEVHDARKTAGDLFRRCFNHEIPDYPRHFVLVYSPVPGKDAKPEVVAYVHQSPFGEVHLCGGMCVDERAYRRFPKWLFEQVREQGGLATIVTRDSMKMLGDSVASFGHVGEPRARAADLRTGFVDTGRPHLMVMWLKDIPETERLRLINTAEAHGPF